MTPKEKAKELVNKFRDFTDGTDSETDRYSPNIEKKNAIQCALICVDEILKSNPTKIDCNSSELNYKYWIEVKQEIEKM